MLDPARASDVAEISFPAGHLGGWRYDFDRPGAKPVDLGPREAPWRMLIGKEEVDGRFALRLGKIVELGESAE